MMLTRRHFGQLAAGLPLAGAVRASGDPDVVVVGAGVAGMAAARVLVDAGRSVRLLEAAPRAGGRCHTDTASFGLPFDQGAMWLRQADRNPLSGFAQLYRFTTGLPQPKDVLFAGPRRLPATANTAYERAFDAFSLALAEAAEENDEDMAAARVLPGVEAGLAPDDRAWLAAAAARLGPLDAGVELEQLSVKDWFNRDEPDPVRLVREGLGTLAGRLAQGLPLSVSTTVSRLTMLRGGAVEVETSRGLLRTQAVILTVSTGVLASGAIAIEPALPSALVQALDGLMMGATLKVAMAFDQRSPAIAFPHNTVLLQRTDDQRVAEFLVRPFGAPMLVCSVGGSLALDLESRGADEHHAFAMESLRAMLGGAAERGLRGRASTSWSRNPLVFGSVTAAKPGQRRARDALRQPVHEAIHLAGEALGERAIQTVHGAYDSGRATARRVLSYLRRRATHR